MRKTKNKIKLLASALIVVFLILIASVVIIVIGKKAMNEYELQIDDLQYELDANTRTVYVASSDILAGETLSEGVNVYKQTIYSGLDEDSYMSESELGSIARIDIPAGEPVMDSCITSLYIDEDSREYEMSVATLMTDQEELDYVDVRIMYPNGEDYTVLSKKVINNLNLENCVFYTYLNEDEILRMASATIDAYTISGTRIYTTRYIESNLQDAATPNYPVRAETIDLLNSDPNIIKLAVETVSLQARMDLEERMKSLSEDQLKAVAEGHSLEDTAKTSVLLDGQYNYEATEEETEELYNGYDEYDDEETEEDQQDEQSASTSSGGTSTFTVSDGDEDEIIE
jgi:hypothetical protein